MTLDSSQEQPVMHCEIDNVLVLLGDHCHEVKRSMWRSEIYNDLHIGLR